MLTQITQPLLHARKRILKGGQRPLTACLISTMLCGCNLGYNNDVGGGSTDEPSFAGPGSAWRLALDDNSTDFTLTRATNISASASLTITGSKTKLSSGFSQLNVSSISGSVDGLSQNDKMTAIEVDDSQVFILPFETNDTQLIATIAADTCPDSDLSSNWIAYKKPSNTDLSATATAMYGTSNYLNSDGSISLNTRYSLVSTSNIGGTSLGSDTCSSGTNNTDGNVNYLSTKQSAIFDTNADFLLAFPIQAIQSQSNTDGEYIGLIYDAAITLSYPAKASCTSGICTIVQVTDISDTSLEGSNQLTLSLDGNVDTPSNGFINAQVVLSSEALPRADADTSQVSCMVNTDLRGNNIKTLNCVGQSATNNSERFTALLVSSS